MDYCRDKGGNLPTNAGRFLHDVARDRILAQNNQSDQLDAKIQGTLGFAAAFVGIALATLALRSAETSRESWIFLAMGGAFFLVIAILGAWAYHVREFEHGPLLNQAWGQAHTGTMDEDKLYCWAAEAYTSAYEANKANVLPKALAVELSFWILGLEFAALSAAILWNL